VNATKLASLVLICVVVLTVVAGVGFALSFGVTQQREAELPNNSIKISAPADALALGHKPLGDPVGNPKPNGPVKR